MNLVLSMVIFAGIVIYAMGFSIRRHILNKEGRVENSHIFYHPDEYTSGRKRTIRIRGMKNETFKKGVELFIQKYSGHGHTVESPKIYINNQEIYLEFHTTNYDLFCQWVYFLTYLEPCRYKVVGWYEMGKLHHDNNISPFSQTTLMIFVPEETDELNFVYLLSPSCICFRQDFTGKRNITHLPQIIKVYEIPPAME